MRILANYSRLCSHCRWIEQKLQLSAIAIAFSVGSSPRMQQEVQQSDR